MTRCTFAFLFCVCASFSLRAQDSSRAVLKFTTTQYWLQNLHEGEVAEYKFQFVNVGDQTLVISEVIQQVFTPDCYRKEPVAPGDTGYIMIRYLTSGKPGYFDKTVTVISNNRDGDIVLHLKGNVFPKPAPDAPIMKFDTTTYWFDTVYQGSTVDYEFRFTNKGKTPLIISTATGNSGCIVPSYPNEPIAPGQSAVIRVVFNTTGRAGPQDKCVTVTSNASEPTIVLHIRGVVIVPPPINQFPPHAPSNK